jgi:two-component system chemotaxis response regulator CheY
MNAKNLLVVDDSATTRMLICLTLKKGESFNIIEASDGTEAVARLASEPVDMVLTDINMPNMNGLELITHIRANHANQNIPIIVITTKGEETDRDQGLALGADAYLLKPISGAQLQSLVKELLP